MSRRKPRFVPDFPIKEIRLSKEIPYVDKDEDTSYLAASIGGPNGILNPVIVNHNRELVVGNRRRLEAIRQGRKTIPALIMDIPDPLQAVADENDCRRPLPPSKAAELYAALKAREAPLAAERRARPGMERHEKLTGQATGSAADRAAEMVGLSRPTAEKALAVVEAARSDPTLGPAVREMDRTGKVEPAFRELQKRREGRKRKKPGEGKAEAYRALVAALGKVSALVPALKRHLDSEGQQRLELALESMEAALHACVAEKAGGQP